MSFEKALEKYRCQDSAEYCILNYMTKPLYHDFSVLSYRPSQIRLLNELQCDGNENYILMYRQSGSSHMLHAFLLWALCCSTEHSGKPMFFVAGTTSQKEATMVLFRLVYEANSTLLESSGISLPELKFTNNRVSNPVTNGVIYFTEYSNAESKIRGHSNVPYVILDNIWSHSSKTNDVIEDIKRTTQLTGDTKFIIVQTSLSLPGTNYLEQQPNIVRLPVYMDFRHSYSTEKEYINKMGQAFYGLSYLLIRK